MNHPAGRLLSVDVLKAVAAQFIVLHHLALYGPMSDIVHDFTPGLIEWLVNHARLAVQIFLVVGGFLAARSLAARRNAPIGNPMSLIWKRYCRLAIPFMAALMLAIACATIARAVLPLNSTPSAPHLLQLIAHLLLIQNLLDLDALSAGVWYVAIDFQLYALLVILLWLSRCASATQYRPFAITLISALAIASLFHFNRISDWDDWALYFFGAYAMGALAFWARESRHRAAWLALMAAGVIAALMLDYRSRIVAALFTAVLLGLTFRPMRQLPSRLAQPLGFLGDISYSVFLVHYPVCLVVNAAFGRAFPADPVANALGMLLAWCLSLLAGILFHQYVEKPAAVWLGGRNMPAIVPR